MNIILCDLDAHLTFAPLTLTRPVGNLRAGIFTNDERWKLYFPDSTISFKTESYIQPAFPIKESHTENLWINASVVPISPLIEKIKALKIDEQLIVNDVWVASRGLNFKEGKEISAKVKDFIQINERWELYQKNDLILEHDFLLATKGKKSKELSKTCQLIGSKNKLFIADSAKVEGAILNTNSGPIYIGENAEIMEGTVVRGGLALCDNAVLKLSSKIYGATTIGPYCKVGGEVNNCVFQAFSNKGHDGFLGNSVIGEWCNIGADTNTSNLKNNYGTVKAYDYRKKAILQTDVQFMGLVMGDHSKTGINTMFNTATVVGVSSTIFGSGFPPKYIPSFSWGGFDSSSKFDFEKAIEAANNMMVRRGKSISKEEEGILKKLFV